MALLVWLKKLIQISHQMGFQRKVIQKQLLKFFPSCVGNLVDENHVMDVADYTYLTYMNIYFKEDDVWVLVTQHVESWSYSDTGPTPEEAEESVLVICANVSRNAQQVYKSTFRGCFFAGMICWISGEKNKQK